MDIEGKKFLVTGGAGFIGSHLVDMLLNEGAAKVVVFDNFIRGGMHNLEEALKDDRATLFEARGDLTRLDEVEKASHDVDGVFHMASLCLTHCQEYPRSALDVNIVGTFNLLDACVKNGIKRLVFASSSSIYGNAVYSPMDENHPLENRNFYGATKIAGEALLRAFYYKHGFNYIGLRFMNVYGPRQDYSGAYVAVILAFIDKIQKGQAPVINGDGSQAFDFVYVEDACRSCILAMKSGLNDQVFNVSSGMQTSILNLAKKIAEIMGKDTPFEFVDDHDKTLVRNRIGSTEKAELELGFIAKVPLEQGLRKVINWKVRNR